MIPTVEDYRCMKCGFRFQGNYHTPADIMNHQCGKETSIIEHHNWHQNYVMKKEYIFSLQEKKR